MSRYTDKDKVFTDASMLDEIEHNLKLMLNNCVLKDVEEALANETEESLAAGDVYVAIKDGTVNFLDFEYTYDIFHIMNKIVIADPSLGLLQFSNKEIANYIADSSLVPEEYRPLLTKIASELYLENYVEKNNYYRKLNGQKDYNTADFFVNPSYIGTDYLPQFVDTTYLDPEEYLLNTPITDFSQYQLSLLETIGAMDKIIDDYPNLGYLRFLGAKAIDIYRARKAQRFELLYLADAEEVVRARFQDILQRNRTVYLKRYYSNAYKWENEYYDKFMIIMLIMQSANDLIAEIPEWYIRREVFDVRTAQYLLESNGIKFFPEIPLKFQISMVRSMNTLIKYKSTTKNIYDIAKVFFLKNVEVYKYYLLKKRNIDTYDPLPDDLNGAYADERLSYLDKNAGNSETEATEVCDGGTATKSTNFVNGKDLDKMYDLQFIRVPVDDTLDNYLHNDIYISRYDSITTSDPYWDGPNDHEYVKQEILKKDFTSQCTKYLSLGTIYSASEYMFQLTYFINLIMNTSIDTENLKLAVPVINTDTTFYLKDLIILLYCFAFKYQEIQTDDLIIWNNRDPHIAPVPPSYDILGDYDPEKLKDYNADGVHAPDEKAYYMMDGGPAKLNKKKMINVNGGRAVNSIVPVDQPETQEIIFDPMTTDTDINGLSWREYTQVGDLDGGDCDSEVPAEERETSVYDGGDAVNPYMYLEEDDPPSNDPCAAYQEFTDKFIYPYQKLSDRILGFNLEADLTELNKTLRSCLHPKFEWMRGYDIADILPTYNHEIHKYPSTDDFPAEGTIGELYEDVTSGYFYMWGSYDYKRVKTLYSKGIQDFKVPLTKQYTDINELTEIYHTNKEIYDNLTLAMRDVDNQDDLFIYEYVYEYLFTMRWNTSYFTMPVENRISMMDIIGKSLPRYTQTMQDIIHAIIRTDCNDEEIIKILKTYGIIPTESKIVTISTADAVILVLEKYRVPVDDALREQITDAVNSLYKRYTEFLKQKDGIIYNFFAKIMSENNLTQRQYNMATYIDTIIASIEAYLATDGIEYIFYFVPTVSWGIVLKYVSLVLNFFKSYKTHILDVSGTLLFDDRTENTSIKSDKVQYFGRSLYKGDFPNMTDIVDHIYATMEKEDKDVLERNDDRIYLRNRYDSVIDINGGTAYQGYWSLDFGSNNLDVAGASYEQTTSYVEFDGGSAFGNEDPPDMRWDPAGAAAKAYIGAKKYIDNLAVNYEPAGAAELARQRAVVKNKARLNKALEWIVLP